jgi:hypothetical protein
MKAIFHTGVRSNLGDLLGAIPWCLTPFGGKPLLEYWLEWAASLGADDVRLVLGDGAFEVESFCGDGSRWGLKITYGFLKDGVARESYLRRIASTWDDGLLYICGPVFPQRLAADATPINPKTQERTTWLTQDAGQAICLLSTCAQDIQAFIKGILPAAQGCWSDWGIDPLPVRDLKAYYDVNMRLVKGENRRYVSQGYGGRDGTSIGYNVQIPPSVELIPPFTIGNDCRFHSIAVIGPNAVIGNHVIVDSQTELSDSVVLDGTYLGRNLEIKHKIVTGTKIISPEDDIIVEISEPWLLARLEAPVRFGDGLRLLAGWLLAVLLTVLQALPFVLLYPWVRLSGAGLYRLSPRLGRRDRVVQLPEWTTLNPASGSVRLFTALALDLFPLLTRAACGHLWLCGHAPLHPERDQAMRKRLHRYYPAAIIYPAQQPAAYSDPTIEMANALYYERYASLREDSRTLFRTFTLRLLSALSE